jgi:hypothetical protein
MAVALAEPQLPPQTMEKALRRGEVRHARERIKFSTNYQTEEQRAQFVDDFHTVIVSHEASDRDRENFVKAFRSQDKASKLYIGQILLEQLEEEVRGTKDERSIRAFLKVAKLINLSKECTLDKQDKKDTEWLLKSLSKIYSEQTVQLSPKKRAVLAAGAAGSLLGLSGNDPGSRQAAYEAARQAGVTTPDTRSVSPGFDLGIDWGNGDGGVPVPDVSLRPRPREKTLVEQEDERLVPASIRALQKPEFNRLFKEGCLDTKEVNSNDKKIIVVDFVKKSGVTCDLKFPQVYEAYPVGDRTQAFQLNNETQVRINQIDATCAIHSFTMAAIIARNRANPGETPVVVNPFIFGEADPTLTQEIYNQLQQELLNDPIFRAKYGPELTAQFARSSPINNAIQRTDVAERVFRSVYGTEVNRKIALDHPMQEPDGRFSFKQNSFTETEWQTLGQKHHFSVEGNKVLADKQTADKIFGLWMEKWYNGLNTTATQQNKVSVPVFSMRYHPEGVMHAYTVVGIKEVDGKKYFQMTEGLNGQLSSYLVQQGARNGENNTVLLPMDKLFSTGLIEAYTFTADKPKAAIAAEERVPSNAVASASTRVESPRRDVEVREKILRSEQFGFRVNSVEAIEKLPSSIGMIRIAGNETAVDLEGRLTNLEAMLEVADKKGLKVVFVYNPDWFPGVTNTTLTEQDLQRSRELMNKQLRAILKHPSVSSIEIGNEVDENKPTSAVRFWKGSLKDYAKFFKQSTDLIREIDKGSGRNTEIILSSFGDSTGVYNPSERNYAELAQALKDNNVDMSQIWVAGHAYHLDQLQWLATNLQKKFGAKGLIITEMNAGRGDRAVFTKEFERMVEFIKKENLRALIHEWKPEMPDNVDYANGHLALDEKDPRAQFVFNVVNQMLARQQ